MENLHSVLAELARFDDASRLYRIDLPGTAAGLLVERWQGREQLADGFEWWVDLLSTDASLPLEQWLGQSATLHTRLADGGDAVRSGLVREAVCLGSDGGLARYRVCLVPWTWLLTQGRHSRVFQDRSVTDIVAAVFADYAPLANWQLGEEVGPFLAQARVRSYCCQYRETDFDFIDRLLAEEGLGWRSETDGEAMAGHRLVIFADSAQLPEDPSSAAEGGVRFHRSDATEARDTVQALGRQRRIGSGTLTLLSDDYKTRQSVTTRLPLAASRDRQAQLDAYDPAGSYAFANQAEAERYAGLMAEAREAQRETWRGQGTVRTFRSGSWCRLTQGPTLDDAAPAELLLVAVHHHGVNNLPQDLRAAVETSLGIAPAWPVAEAARTADEAARKRAQAVGYANHFQAVSRERPWRPVRHDATGARLSPRPTAPGYQTAVVVGDDTATAGHELHCDALGRIRVKFHWQQGDTPDDQRSCWIRVAQRYAGPGVGSQFLPRIGQEVLVAFLEGDIDRPIVMGTLYNGQGEAGIVPTPGGRSADQGAERPAMEGRAGRSEAGSVAPGTAAADLYATARDHVPSAQANRVGGHAPAWHGHGAGDAAHRNAAALWGIQSKEWGGSGHNRLVFDDSDGQLRLQLATTQARTQLNLGHLIHQADNYRGSFRGEGFELRSDAWGAVRAEAGLWLSAYGNAGDSPAGDAVPATALLQQVEQLGKVFSEAANTHQTVKLAASEGPGKATRSQLIDDQAPLQALLTSARTTVPGKTWGEAHGAAKGRKPDAGTGRVPHTGDALLGLTAPAGIGLVAGQGLHWAIGETLTLASGAASNVVVANDLRLHSGQAIGLLASAVEGGSPPLPPAGEGQGEGASVASLSLVTAEGQLEFEAQHDQAKFQSRDQLNVVSANAEVELAAGKTVHLATAGGASITIEGGNIVFACPGTITVHAGKKSFVGPAQLSREMNSWSETKFDDVYVVRDETTGEPLRNMRVELIRNDGAKQQLVTDAQGRLPKQQSEWLEQAALRILGKASD